MTRRRLFVIRLHVLLLCLVIVWPLFLDAQDQQEDWISQLHQHKEELRQETDPANQVDILLAIESIFYDRWEIDSCEYYLLQAQQIAQQAGDSALVAMAYTYLGRLYLDQNDLAQSLDYFQQVRRIHNSLGNAPKEAAALSNMSVIFHRQSDFYKAIDHLQQSLRIYREHLDSTHINLAYTYSNLGDNYFLLEQYDEALHYYQKALRIKEVQLPSDNRSLLINYNNVATCHLHLKQLDSADVYIETTLKQEPQVPLDWAIADAWRIKGLILQVSGHQHPDALYALQKSLTIYKRTYGDHHYWVAHGHVEIGKYYAKQERFDLSLNQMQQALMVYDSTFTDPDVAANPVPVLSATMYFLVELLIPKISVLYQRAIHGKGSLLDFQEALQGHLDLVRTIDLLGSTYSNEASLLELGRQFHPVYEQAVEIAFELYERTGDESYLSTAFQLTEKGKNIALVQALSKAEAAEGFILPPELRAREQAQEEEIQQLELQLLQAGTTSSQQEDSLKSLLFEAKRVQDSIRKDIQEVYPSYFDWKLSPQPVDLQQIRQQVLQKEEAILSYKLTPRHVFCFVLDQQALSGYRIPIPKDFAQRITALRNSVIHQTDDFAMYAHELYLLLRQSLRLPTHIRRLMIIPDKDLYALPFEVLLSHKPETLNYAQYPYLVKTYAIRYGISLQVALQHSAQVPTRTSRFVGFAPHFTVSSGLRSLPGAREEVIDIHSRMGGEVYLDEVATESLFQSSIRPGDVVHLATHAIAEQAGAEQPRLMFSPHPESLDDAQLFDDELYRMRIDADLVVLSACNSGIGTILDGEGSMSLARGFVYAGCPNIVMTLWEIPDLTSRSLMLSFYEKMQAGLSIDMALHSAKLNYLEQADEISARPIFWAGYSYMGQSRVIRWADSGNWMWGWLVVGMLVFGMGLVWWGKGESF